jgi:hypothetical protein
MKQNLNRKNLLLYGSPCLLEKRFHSETPRQTRVKWRAQVGTFRVMQVSRRTKPQMLAMMAAAAKA